MRIHTTTVSAVQRERNGPAWYAVQTRPRREQQVAQALEEQLQLEVYLPEVWKQRGDELNVSPFFPGYLFVNADLSATPASSINTLPGVVRLVPSGAVPQHIPGAVLAELRQQVDEVNAHTRALDRGFAPGATVRLLRGALRGLEGTVVGSPGPGLRVRVLIEFFGRLRDLELETAALGPAGTPFDPKRRRRTRGGGRRITVRQPVSG